MAHPTVSSGPVGVRRSGAASPTRSMRRDEVFFLGLAAALWVLTAIFGASHLHVGSLYLPLWLPFAINASIASVAAVVLYPRWRFFDDAADDEEGDDVVTVPRTEWEQLHQAVRTEATPISVEVLAPALPEPARAWEEPPALPAPTRPRPRAATAPVPVAPAEPSAAEPARMVSPAAPPPARAPPPRAERPAVPASPAVRPSPPAPAPDPAAPPTPVARGTAPVSPVPSRPRAAPPAARPPPKAPPTADTAAQDVDEIIRLLEGSLSATSPRAGPAIPVAPRGTKGVCIHCGEKIRPESAAILRCSGCGGGLCVDGLAESVRAGSRGFCPACRALGAPPSPRG